MVSGIGLEQLTSGYDSSPRVAEAVIPAAVSYLVVAPLITAICVYALQSVAAGGTPRAREAIVKGFESFSPIFFAVLLAALGHPARGDADRAGHLPVRALVLRAAGGRARGGPRARRAARERAARGGRRGGARSA